MDKPVTIAVDAMGGDAGPDVTVGAVERFLHNDPDARIILVGDEHALRARLRSGSGRVEFVQTGQVVGMDEPPMHALRNKKDSSMWVAVNLVKEGRAEACISAGNTGALLAISYYILRTLPGIERPALITELPGISNSVYMLDLGANIDCKVEHLLQFAVMGSVLATALTDNQEPRIGLLNIGSEETKGNELVKEADRKLRQSPFNYVGYVEADRIYFGDCDVVVTDGFSGNISLKTAEGAVALVMHHIKAAFGRDFVRRLTKLAVAPAMKEVVERMDSRRYNGATLLGLQGVVIKSHGKADELAFEHGLRVACTEARRNIPQMIDRKLEQVLIFQ